MDRTTSTNGSALLQTHFKGPSSNSASSEQGLAGVAHTAGNDSSTNGALAPANNSLPIEMDALGEVPQNFPAQYSTELKYVKHYSFHARRELFFIKH